MLSQSTNGSDLVAQTNNYFATLAVSTVGSKVQATRPKLLAVVESCIHLRNFLTISKTSYFK
jgi:hypothetical protein